MSRNAWISVAIFVVLLVLVVATREEKVSVGVRSLALPTINKTAVTRIEISGKSKAILENDQGRWTVADPEKPDARFGVEQSALDAALDALAELDAGSFVTGRAAKHEELELTDETGLRVRVTQKEGPSLDVIFGRAAKGGGNYLRLAGNDEVFVGKGRFASTVRKDAKQWRKRKLVDATAEDLVSIEVHPPGSDTYTIESFEEGEGEDAKSGWRLPPGTQLPAGFVIDETIIKRIATTLANLRAADFADDGGKGLGDPSSGGKLVARKKDNTGVVVSFGDEDDAKRTYTQVEGDAQVYLVSTFSVNNLRKTLRDLRDLSLARFDAPAATRVVVKGENETVEVAKQDGVWTLVAPASPPAGYEFDPAGVDAKLSALARLKGIRRFEDASAATGLAKPDVVVTVTLEGGSEKRIAFGGEAKLPEGESGSEVFVQGAEEPLPYSIGKWQRDRYAKPLDLFKKVAPPPGGPPGGGGIPGMESLPPDVREKLMKQLQQQGMPGR